MKKRDGVSVLGIDPGLNSFGFGLVVEHDRALHPVKYGQYVVPGKISFESKLVFIGEKIDKMVEELKPDVIAIEKIYVAKNTQIALALGIVSGVIASSGLSRHIEVAFITPAEIKKILTGTGQALKQQVSFMVEKLLGLQKSPGEHAVDALAAAIGFISINRFNHLIEKL